MKRKKGNKKKNNKTPRKTKKKIKGKRRYIRNVTRYRPAPTTKRHCEKCNKTTTFKYNPYITHSECTRCGWRKGYHSKGDKQ